MAELNRQPILKEFPVSSSADVLIVRRAVHEMASGLGFSENRCAEIVLSVSELAQNHVSVHTEGGRIIVSGLYLGSCSMITLFSADQGPGIQNLPQAMSDGFTSKGSYGTGLGTVCRLADDFAICSGTTGLMPCSKAMIHENGRGTVVAASFLNHASDTLMVPGLSLSAIVCPKPRETFCGDGLYLKRFGDTMLIVLADVLGHGRDAAESIATMWELLEIADPASHLEQTVCAIDRGLGGKRGLAGLFMKIDLSTSMISTCGVGNIGAILHDGKRQVSLTSLSGVIGQNINCRRLMIQDFRLENGISCIIFSDGVDGSNFYAGFRQHLPPLFNSYIALVTALSNKDDASVVAWKWQKK